MDLEPSLSRGFDEASMGESGMGTKSGLLWNEGLLTCFEARQVKNSFLTMLQGRKGQRVTFLLLPFTPFPSIKYSASQGATFWGNVFQALALFSYLSDISSLFLCELLSQAPIAHHHGDPAKEGGRRKPGI